jgi:nicotinamide-nucleotide amidase
MKTINNDLRIEILALGSELLTPYFQDTNSLFLTRRLNDLGMEVRFKTVVGDREDDLRLAFEQALSRSDLIFSIGGLGPTKDDLTREVWASVLGQRLILREDVLETIKNRFVRRKIKMPDVNKKQAFVMENSKVLANKWGTAPGLWVDSGSRTIILLPGPPHEIEPMFEESVWPLLQPFQTQYASRLAIKTTGLTESEIETRLGDVYPQIPGVHLTTLCHPGQIEIHLTCFSKDGHREAQRKIGRAGRLIRKKLQDSVFSTSGEELEQVIGRMLKKNRGTLATAESCSGGFLASRLTDVPGSSAYFLQGAVTYSNEAKIRQLGVPAEQIRIHGAVSRQVAGAMAAGIKKSADSSYGLSITGIAGPSGGTADKSVGLVYTGLAFDGGIRVRKNLFLGNRSAVKFQSTQKALDMLRRYLLEASATKDQLIHGK